MTRPPLIPELAYLPARNGGVDQAHTHLTLVPSADERESCGACAQLENDFTWLRFHDAVAPAAADFGTPEDAVAGALEDMRAKHRGLVPA